MPILEAFNLKTSTCQMKVIVFLILITFILIAHGLENKIEESQQHQSDDHFLVYTFGFIGGTVYIMRSIYVSKTEDGRQFLDEHGYKVPVVYGGLITLGGMALGYISECYFRSLD
ncbi:hypothetical protein [Endozoicomonas numazuensis]|uniref:Uncharacterized protein n=1 Tax=Endozoicomonas numazuensis TaxID=1137799 RepID=A0A081NGK3_9GAMM|nr:hypothetical protein [Endozoicomonas numazuensis]KEQ17574.1 hypothetical protein GZ78_17720 [Endozoicomonas numazuensis]KEQ17576.1 hypothetical protein GZ78_17730 [Endozoicomonas numazuensis]